MKRCGCGAPGGHCGRELLVTKSQYTDELLPDPRRQPMSLAAEMQWQLLPPLTFAPRRVVIAGLLEPAYEVAGEPDYALNGRTPPTWRHRPRSDD